MTFLNFLSSEAVAIIKAVLLLVLAFIVSGIVKNAVLKLMNKSSKLNGVLDKLDGVADGDSSKAKEYFAKLIYLVVFLLFVPGIFSALGVEAVTAPISNVLNSIWGFLPNLIGAVVVVIVGSLIAKIVRQLLIPLFAKLKVDKLQEKAGIKVQDSAKLSNTLAYLVYVLILIPVYIVALQILQISAITTPAVGVLNTIIGFIPNIIVAIALVAIGCLIAKIGGNIVEQLIASTGVDSKVSLPVGDNGKFYPSRIAKICVKAVVIIFFCVEALNVLKLKVLTDIGATIIGYMPKALAAALVGVGAIYLCKLVEKMLVKHNLKKYVLISKALIIVIAIFMVLTELGIAPAIVSAAFIISLAAIAVAFAVAFGVGGKDFARKMLDKLDKKIEEKDE